MLFSKYTNSQRGVGVGGGLRWVGVAVGGAGVAVGRCGVSAGGTAVDVGASVTSGVGTWVGVSVTSGVGVAAVVGVSAGVGVREGSGVLVGVGVAVEAGETREAKGQVQLTVIIIATSIVPRAAISFIFRPAALFTCLRSSVVEAWRLPGAALPVVCKGDILELPGLARVKHLNLERGRTRDLVLTVVDHLQIEHDVSTLERFRQAWVETPSAS